MIDQHRPDLSEQQKLIKRWLGSGSLNLFGKPFAGKDTQSARIASWLKAPVIGGGDIIRSTQDVPLEVRQAEESGMLVPQDGYLALITPYLERHEFDGKPLVLCSVGRWQGEETSIIASAQSSGHPIKCAVYIELSDDQTEERFRIAHQDEARTTRADHHTFETRLEEFRAKTLPVLTTYHNLGLLITVSGTGSIDEIEHRIINALYDHALKTT